MEIISRRKFLKTALTVIASLPVASMFIPVSDARGDAVLTVDKDGNATLHGWKIAVDNQNNATVK